MIDTIKFRYIYFSFLIYISYTGYEHLEQTIQTIGKDNLTVMLYFILFYAMGAFINAFAYVIFEILHPFFKDLSQNFLKNKCKFLKKKVLVKTEFFREFILSFVIILFFYSCIMGILVLMILTAMYFCSMGKKEKRLQLNRSRPDKWKRCPVKPLNLTKFYLKKTTKQEKLEKKIASWIQKCKKYFWTCIVMVSVVSSLIFAIYFCYYK